MRGIQRLRTMRAICAAAMATLSAAGISLADRASAAEFAPTCTAFIEVISKVHSAPVPPGLDKVCECVGGKLNEEDKAHATDGLDAIVQASKTGKASDLTAEQKDGIKKFGDANDACMK